MLGVTIEKKKREKLANIFFEIISKIAYGTTIFTVYINIYIYAYLYIFLHKVFVRLTIKMKYFITSLLRNYENKAI